MSCAMECTPLAQLMRVLAVVYPSLIRGKRSDKRKENVESSSNYMVWRRLEYALDYL